MVERVERAKRLVDPAVASDELQRVTAEAARLSHGGFAQLSVLSDHEVIVAVEGAPLPRGLDVPFEDAVCVHVLRSDAPVAVSDAREERRLEYLGVVERDLLVSYLGVPVRVGSDGDVLAVLCVWDQHRREWTEDEVGRLESVAVTAAHHLDAMLGGVQ